MPSLSSTAKLHIGVQDVDDQNPRFLHERYSVTLNADAPLVYDQWFFFIITIMLKLYLYFFNRGHF